jgi:putative holliday junction resolvase
LTRVLALDYGSARCGCAVSDPTGTLATPLESVSDAASDQGLERVAALVRELQVERVVVGLPVSLSGEEGAQARETRDFAARLSARLDVPVETWDERFTTKMAQRTPGRSAEDSRAAAHLLQGYLEAHGQRSGG